MKHETFDTYIIFFPSPETLVYEISKNDFCNLFGKREFTFYISQEIFHASCWVCYGVPSRANIGQHFPFLS